ncbi:aminotransferase class IV, partial [[Clostridium] innocuum]|nr:aminotransferase class IV [[Clostridium] innocuum]
MNGIEKKGIGERYLWKGAMVKEQDIHISLQDRGHVFGDGLYEVVRVYNGKLFGLKRHLDRLFQGADVIDFNLQYTREEFEGFFQQLVEENGLHSGYVYMQLTRGDDGIRNHLYPGREDQRPVLSGFAVHAPRNVEKIQAGTTAISVEDIRWKYCHVKTLNLIPNCMARSEAKRKGAGKAILVKDGIVTEEKSGSILIVQD